MTDRPERAAGEVPLRAVAPEQREQLQRRARLDALGDDGEAQRVAELDGGANELARPAPCRRR